MLVLTLQQNKEPCPPMLSSTLSPGPKVSKGPADADEDWHGQYLTHGSHEQEISDVNLVALDEE